MLLEIAPKVYEGKMKVLYIKMLKAIYGMLQSSLLYYKKFCKDIESIGFEVNPYNQFCKDNESIGFEVNPYNPCVANHVAIGKQHTVSWHINDLKSIHIDSKVNDQFLQWLKKTYASGDIGHVKAIRGNCHNYLAMILDFLIPEVLQVDITPSVTTILQ